MREKGTAARQQSQQHQHIFIKNGVKYFRGEYFRRYQLQDFEADLDTLDDDSDFIQHVMSSLEVNGWDRDRPLLYSVPFDPDSPNAKQLTGIIIDARHRSWAWQLLFEQGKHVPEPNCKPIPVTSIEHAMILRAYYEILNRSKNASIAKRHAEKIINGIFDKLNFANADDACDFFKKNGFADSTTITQLFRKFQKKKEAATAGRDTSNKRAPRTNVGDIFSQAFGNKIKIPPENTLPVEEDGITVSLLCPDCKSTLICSDCRKEVYLLKTSDGRTIVKHLEGALTH